MSANMYTGQLVKGDIVQFANDRATVDNVTPVDGDSQRMRVTWDDGTCSVYHREARFAVANA